MNAWTKYTLLASSLSFSGLTAEKSGIPEPPTPSVVVGRTNRLGINIGFSLEACRKKIRWMEVEKPVNALVLSPFAETLSFLDPKRTVMWHDGKTNSYGWPTFIVAAFRDAEKTSLVDLFEVTGEWCWPLVDGEYEASLRRVHVGDDMGTVYRRLGRQRGVYTRNTHGTWLVVFVYPSLGGRFVEIRVEAASGRVLEIHDATI